MNPASPEAAAQRPFSRRLPAGAPGIGAGVLARGGAPLGRWLTAGYRRLDLVVAGVTTLVVYVALLLAALFLSSFGASQRAPSSLELAPMQAAIATAAPLQGSASLFVTLALATTWLVAGASRKLRAPAPEGRPHVDGQPLPPISLLTAGCPAPGPVVAASGTLRRNDGGIAARPVQVLVGCQTMFPPKPGDRFAAAAAVLLCSMPAAGCAQERSRASYIALISRVTSSITTSIRFGCRRRRA